MFSFREFRKLDMGLCFSYRNQKYQLPTHYKKEKLMIKPKEVIQVAISHRIGIKVLFRNFALTPIPILKYTKNDKPLESKEEAIITYIKRPAITIQEGDFFPDELIT